MISLIVAVDENGGIGYNGQLLTRIPEDLKRFKTLTTGHIVIMGRKTWDSLSIKPLPNRRNIVISNQKQENFMTIPECLEEIKDIEDEIFVIGGGNIYKYFLPKADRIYITLIHKSFDKVDTYFPVVDKKEWTVIEHIQNNEKYAFITVDRRNLKK